MMKMGEIYRCFRVREVSLSFQLEVKAKGDVMI